MDQASRAVRLIDRGQFKSIRQVSRATDVAKSTIHDRRAGRQPRGQEEIKHVRLTRYQEDVLAKYILTGWRRSGLYPLDARKVLDKPEVARYRATTPDLAPPQSRLTLTPQDDYEYEQI
jgi:hypothetical protein